MRLPAMSRALAAGLCILCSIVSIGRLLTVPVRGLKGEPQMPAQVADGSLNVGSAPTASCRPRPEQLLPTGPVRAEVNQLAPRR